MNDLIYSHCMDVLKLAHNAYVTLLVGRDAQFEVASLISAAKYLEALLEEFGIQERIIEKDTSNIDLFDKKDLEVVYRKIAKIVRGYYEAKSAVKS